MNLRYLLLRCRSPQEIEQGKALHKYNIRFETCFPLEAVQTVARCNTSTSCAIVLTYRFTCWFWDDEEVGKPKAKVKNVFIYLFIFSAGVPENVLHVFKGYGVLRRARVRPIRISGEARGDLRYKRYLDPNFLTLGVTCGVHDGVGAVLYYMSPCFQPMVRKCRYSSTFGINGCVMQPVRW